MIMPRSSVINGHIILNEKGQFVIETVLLLTISTMLFLALVRGLRETGFVENIFTRPWIKISGMIENGVWADPARSRTLHPHNFNAVATLKQQGN